MRKKTDQASRLLLSNLAGKTHPAPSQAAAPAPLKTSNFTLAPTLGLAGWLAEAKVSVAVSTYQAGQVIILGRRPTGELMYTARAFDSAMGICLRGGALHLGARYQIHRFQRRAEGAGESLGYDAQWAPRAAHVTGHIHVHDIVHEETGRLVFVNTLFNCLCTTDPEYSFRPVWTPPWISAIAPGDRCHLNGLGMRDGLARYVTSVARTDEVDGWRKQRVGGGVLWDVQRGEPVLENLTMPHSPRWHGDAIYFINSGTGHLCRVTPGEASHSEVCFIPGFARGLTLHGNFALVGTSAQRANRTFSDLPLEANMKKAGATGRCAMYVINLTTGQIDHALFIEGDIQELYDLCVIPGCRMANLVGFMNQDVESIHDPAPTHRS